MGGREGGKKRKGGKEGGREKERTWNSPGQNNTNLGLIRAKLEASLTIFTSHMTLGKYFSMSLIAPHM